MQFIRQFINGMTNCLLRNSSLGLHEAIELERHELRGMKYIDVGYELELVLSTLLLKPLHGQIISLLARNQVKSRILQKVIESSWHMEKRPALVETGTHHLIDHIRFVFNTLREAYSPERKLEYFVRIYEAIDEHLRKTTEDSEHGIRQDFLPDEFIVHQRLFSKAGMLSSLEASSDGWGLVGSELEVIASEEDQQVDVYNFDSTVCPLALQVDYVEGLISRSNLHASSKGSQCLTAVTNFLNWARESAGETGVRQESRPSDTADDSLSSLERISQLIEGEDLRLLQNSWPDRPSDAASNRLTRSFQLIENATGSDRPDDSLEQAVVRESLSLVPAVSDMNKDWSMVSSLTTRGELENWDLSNDWNASHLPMDSPTEVNRLQIFAIDEARKRLVLHSHVLRPSLTVRELCNVIAHRMRIFDPKDFGLFAIHYTTESRMDDYVHLQRYFAGTTRPEFTNPVLVGRSITSGHVGAHRDSKSQAKFAFTHQSSPKTSPLQPESPFHLPNPSGDPGFQSDAACYRAYPQPSRQFLIYKRISGVYIFPATLEDVLDGNVSSTACPLIL